MVIKRGCDICLHPEGKIKKFKTYQPSKERYEEHFVCEKCIHQLVNNYFNISHVL